MAEPELGNAGLIRKDLYKADPDAEMPMKDWNS
jgi:hypothetical protein